MLDLGPLYYFLGIKVVYGPRGQIDFLLLLVKFNKNVKLMDFMFVEERLIAPLE